MAFNIVDVNYERSGQSSSTNEFGMRDMQAKAFEHRDEKYLLLKAPPACGKSRALMFIALDKLINQGIKKVIVSVPERSIGSSFKTTDLTSYGFFSDWEIQDEYNLCTAGKDESKVKKFINFLQSEGKILVCTHATLRFAFEQSQPEDYNNILLAIDEFHHASANEENKLGTLIKNIIQKSSAHIMAMTGSYFRGDSEAILLPEDEANFKSVSYNYYDQLNGYEFLKSLGIGYHFYQGKYTEAITEVLDPARKTIIHIPPPNSGESTKIGKHEEVNIILSHLGETIKQDSDTGVIHVKQPDGNVLKVADLVWDEGRERDRIMEYLRNVDTPEDIDIIIALGMAKEGFDWAFCEHALTIGYRGSLTEIIQIIGRCTRDSENKSHAQFTNLIAQPDAEEGKVSDAVNNMLKAITCSLLMEQVLAPNFKFKRKRSEEDISEGNNIFIRGLKDPSSKRVRDIVENDINELQAQILQDDIIVQAMASEIDPEVINTVMIPKVIQIRHPDLSQEELEEVSQHVVAHSVVKTAETKEVGGKKLIRMANRFINIEELHIDLIREVNPFQKAYEMLSKSVTPKLLKTIQGAIESNRIKVTLDEALVLAPKVKKFIKEYGRKPDIASSDEYERRMAEAIIIIQQERRKQGI